MSTLCSCSFSPGEADKAGTRKGHRGNKAKQIGLSLRFLFLFSKPIEFCFRIIKKIRNRERGNQKKHLQFWTRLREGLNLIQ
jgi:hypothetical protein